jgi:hypothetical protein
MFAPMSPDVQVRSATPPTPSLRRNPQTGDPEPNVNISSPDDDDKSLNPIPGSSKSKSGDPTQWTRQRKDNHVSSQLRPTWSFIVGTVRAESISASVYQKEVERRRRETINEGINELRKIVPGAEKNKGSILARAVQYIQQLKEKEASNIEKWTLEKLLSDQVLAEVQGDVAELKRLLSEREDECRSLREDANRLRAELGRPPLPDPLAHRPQPPPPLHSNSDNEQPGSSPIHPSFRHTPTSTAGGGGGGGSLAHILSDPSLDSRKRQADSKDLEGGKRIRAA